MNGKQLQFIEHYLVNGNAREAYQEVFPKSSYNTALTNGFKLLQTAEIKQVIELKQKELAERCTIKKIDIINTVASILNDINAKHADRLKASSILLNALGYNAPTETNINMNCEQRLFTDLDE
jgi:phage terminase small subunit